MIPLAMFAFGLALSVGAFHFEARRTEPQVRTLLTSGARRHGA
jgi:hypothetical protein